MNNIKIKVLRLLIIFSFFFLYEYCTDGFDEIKKHHQILKEREVPFSKELQDSMRYWAYGQEQYFYYVIDNETIDSCAFSVSVIQNLNDSSQVNNSFNFNFSMTKFKKSHDSDGYYGKWFDVAADAPFYITDTVNAQWLEAITFRYRENPGKRIYSMNKGYVLRKLLRRTPPIKRQLCYFPYD